MAPHNTEAEEAALGSLLLDPDAIFNVASFLNPEDFYREKNGWIYDAVRDLHNRREPADFVTLCDELERRGQLEEVGGAAYITFLINAVPTAIHAEYYARIVERTAILRRLIGAAGQIAALAYEDAEDVDEVVDRAEQVLFGVSQRRITRDLVSIKQIIGAYYDRIDYLYQHRDELIGIPTSFPLLDKLLGGLQPSDLIIVAGRPSMGKTSLVLSIAQNAARKFNQRVALFSLEMSSEQVVQRLVSAETGIDSQRLRLGDLRDDEWPLFVEATGILSEVPIFIDDTPSISALQMRTKSRRLHAEHGLDLVIVDYLQLMRGDTRSENRVQEISAISRALKGLARELNVPVVAVSQLSRAVESRKDHLPILSDLRESGCLTGDTLIQLTDGRRVSIRQLAKDGGSVPVMALNEITWQLEPTMARKAWYIGNKPVLHMRTQLGHGIRATANHKFRTLTGWKRLDQLEVGEHISTLYKANMSRERALRVARVTQSDALLRLATSGIYWDRVAAIESIGVEDVYDLEVPEHHNFVAEDVVVHNSIEQDADVVMFIYREEIYDPDTERKNIADVIVAKHRNGPTGKIPLFFQKELAQFHELELVREELKL